MTDNTRLSQAVRAWREQNPDGLVGRLIALQQRNPAWALTLAYYTERYYAEKTPAGEPWPYQWLMADVATWPEPDEPPYKPCSMCEGTGYVVVACDWYDMRQEQWQPSERIEPCPKCTANKNW